MSVHDSSLDIQLRDIAVLRGLLESRSMTPAHVAAIYFDGKKEAAQKRLQKIKAAGLVGARQRKPYEPSVLFLTRKGLTILQNEGILTEYPRLNLTTLDRRARVSDFTLRHELEVMDVKAAFHSGVKKAEKFAVAKFSTWPLLHQFEAFRSGYGGSEVMVKPDGFICIHENEVNGGLSEHTFFLEVDRSTETQDMLVARAGCYLNYYKSGNFAVRNGATRADFKEFPFRVLMVFKTAERRNNTAERLLQNNPPILTQVYLATLADVTASPFGTIWIRPRDYRDATEGTRFNPMQRRGTSKYGYTRQTERELFVEASLKKISLFDQ